MARPIQVPAKYDVENQCGARSLNFSEKVSLDISKLARNPFELGECIQLAARYHAYIVCKNLL